MPDIVISNLTKTYGSVTAIANVSLNISHGDFFVLLGPSGAGKSSIINVFTGLIAPDSGSVTIGGVEIVGKGKFVPPQKRGISAVFQDGGLWAHMTVEKHLLFVLEGRLDKNAAKARAAKYLDIVKLTGKENRYPHELSGGERQRLALARALVVENKCLLLDEPFANLDRPLVLELIVDITTLHKELDLTTFFVTHQQEDALFLATKMAMMRDGRIMQLGSPIEIYYTPANLYVASFFGDNNMLLCSPTPDGYTCCLGPISANISCKGNEKLIACVRPSSICASREGQGVEGSLVASHFKGDYWIGEFELKGGERLRVNMGAKPPEPGSYRLSVCGRYTVLRDSQ